MFKASSMKFPWLILLFIGFIIAIGETSAGQFLELSRITRSLTSSETQAEAVKNLIKRLLPDRHDEFTVSINSSFGPDNLDTFELETLSSGKIAISASSGVAAALGFQHYLKYFCGCHISWSGDQLNLPESLPVVKPPLKITSPHKFRYYQNVCTSSYSFVWWNWSRWEREIDWMALNGINLPLAFNGQEAIWLKVYTSLGISSQDVRTYLGGPAFLAWIRMGNIDQWGGPLPDSWIQGQLKLQKQIIQRMREFGMTPVLPAFSGHVPEQIVSLYPNATVTKLGTWGHFTDPYCCTYLLDPEDELFKTIGRAFILTMKEEFGVDHVYSADTFNENVPKSSDPAYLSKASSSVYDAMLSGDPQAVWLMQGWLFFKDSSFWGPEQIKALLQAVPLGRMIVLDLMAESYPVYNHTSSFYGQPFIWCMLHNFGGNLRMFGTVETVRKGPLEALSFPGTTLVGTGLTPEGINQNDVMYELMNEMGWRNMTIPDLELWTNNYTDRRYGATSNPVQKAWKILTATVYNCSDGHENHNKGIPVMRPSKSLAPDIWYDIKQLGEAWRLMLLGTELENNSLFRYDLVDLTRQVLQDISSQYYKSLISSFVNKSLDGVTLFGLKLVQVLVDLDQILSSDEHFLLGNWLQQAKLMATTPDEETLYEYNARNQITLWGPKGELHDYANKMWSGLTIDFYRERWALYVQYLTDSLEKKHKYNGTEVKEMLLNFEEHWNNERNIYSIKPIGDSFKISADFYAKYEKDMFSTFSVPFLAKKKIQKREQKRPDKSWYFDGCTFDAPPPSL